MDLHRSSRRFRTLLEGQIVFDNRVSPVECIVRDLSDTGARIAFPHPVEIPPEFLLEIPMEGLSVQTCVMWSKEKECGVKFINTPGLVTDSPVPRDSPRKASTSDISRLIVQEILDEARQQIADAIGIPAGTIRLKMEIN
jgi:hypothetical protein